MIDRLCIKVKREYLDYRNLKHNWQLNPSGLSTEAMLAYALHFLLVNGMYRPTGQLSYKHTCRCKKTFLRFSLFLQKTRFNIFGYFLERFLFSSGQFFYLTKSVKIL